jgi:hypothetical protein
MDYEKDEQGQSTDNLRFYYNGQWQVIPNSKNLTPNDWQNPIDKSELAGAIESGFFIMPDSKAMNPVNDVETRTTRAGSEWLPVVLLPLPAEELPRIIVDFNGGVTIDMLPVLIVRFVPDTNGQLIPLGEAAYAADKSGAGFDLLEGGGRKSIPTGYGEVFRKEKFKKVSLIQEGSIYFLGVYQEPGKDILPQTSWQGTSKVTSFIPQEKSYQAVVANPSDFLQENRWLVLMPNALTSILILKPQ